MAHLAHESAELAQLYNRRFNSHITYRNQIWKVLTEKFFSRFIDPGAVVLDLGCGYGEFSNHVRCAKKFAMDLNPTAQDYLVPDITFLQQDCSQPWDLAEDSLDVVFTSNFFEHLPSRRSLADTLGQARRCLRSGGRIIAMGPNSRYVGGAYWDFWDHHIALTERSLVEVLEIEGFRIEKVIPRFLPYTMVNSRRYPMLLVSCYLAVPLAWRMMGKQFLVMARKG